MARRRAKAAPKGKDEDVRTVAMLVTAGIISLVVAISVILAPIPQVGPDEGIKRLILLRMPTMDLDGTNTGSQTTMIGTGTDHRTVSGC